MISKDGETTVLAAQRTQKIGDDIGVIAFVQNSPLFRGVSEQWFTRLIDAATVEDWASTHIVENKGSSVDQLGLIFDGSISLVEQSGVELAHLERQGLFGESVVLTRQPLPWSIVARTDSRVIRFPGELVRELAEAVPSTGKLLAMLMAARLKELEKQTSRTSL